MVLLLRWLSYFVLLLQYQREVTGFIKPSQRSVRFTTPCVLQRRPKNEFFAKSTRRVLRDFDNDDNNDDEIVIDEKKLREFWLKAGKPSAKYSEDAALQEMMLAEFMSDDDDDDDNEEVYAQAYRDHIQNEEESALKGLPEVNSSPQPAISTEDDQPSVFPGRSVGIDLGTTYSAVSIIEAGMPVIIPIKGARITPSVVAYTSNSSILTGETARRQLVTNSANTFASVKRIIGRSVKEVKQAGEKLSTHKLDKKKPNAELVCPNLKRNLQPEEISAEILRYLIKETSAYLGGEEITKAVVTVPAYFLPHQCDATIRAGELAGLKKVKLLREPEAAALAYGLTQRERQIVLVFDLGGGTFDVSVLEVITQCYVVTLSNI
jgi:hypothetical protein